MRSKSEGQLLGQGLWSNLFYYLHINYAIAVLSSHSAWLIVFVFQKVGWNVRGVKCPWGEMSEGWNVFGVKCLWGEMYRGEMSWGEMSSGWNVLTPFKLIPCSSVVSYWRVEPNIFFFISSRVDVSETFSADQLWFRILSGSNLHIASVLIGYFSFKLCSRFYLVVLEALHSLVTFDLISRAIFLCDLTSCFSTRCCDFSKRSCWLCFVDFEKIVNLKYVPLKV